MIISMSAHAEKKTNAGAPSNELRSLDTQIQSLKKEVLDLNRDLFMLEEELLFPSNTQISVFLSLDIGSLFQLDSVQLRLDDKIVANHLYTKSEIDALKRGGVQRIFTGNLPSGKHEIVAYYTGIGPNNRTYKQGSTTIIEKTSAAQFIELKISDDTSKQQPTFEVKVWE
jgi:hypothetical protein